MSKLNDVLFGESGLPHQKQTSSHPLDLAYFFGVVNYNFFWALSANVF